MKRAMAAVALAMSLYGGAAFSQDKPVFVFTAIPDQDETRLVERFTRVAYYLQSKLFVPVKYLPVKSYPAAVTAFTNGQVQLAWFGGFTDEVFARVGFSGDHSRTIQLVQSGAFEVGVLDFTVWELDKRAGKIDPTQVVVIWETPTFPDYQWTVRGDVDKTYGAGFKEKLRAALLAIDDKAILDQFARSKFIPAKNSDYDPIEEVGKVTNLLN
jgi:phosphonate transport system substrate-binding protein